MATTWNPSDKGTTVTLSGGDLITSTAAASKGGVRATVSKSTGKWYWEITVPTAGSSYNLNVGVATAAWDLSHAGNIGLGGTTTDLGYRAPGDVQFNFTSIFTGAAWANGDVIGIAFDADAHTVAFYKNNVLMYTATGANVPANPLFPAASGNGAGNLCPGTANFGATAFAYTPPAGYTALDGGGGGSSLTHAMTGGVSVGGAATIYPAVRVSHQMTGGVVIGGTAAFDATQPVIYVSELPTGGMRMDGEALVVSILPEHPTGGMVMGGAAIVQDSLILVTQGGMVMGGLAEALLVSAELPTGGMVMSGTAPMSAMFAEAVAGGMVMGGSALVDARYPLYVPSGGMIMGGSALAYMLNSGSVTTPANPYGEDFPGWMVNMDTFAASRYVGLAASSIVQFNGKTYISNGAGIYELNADTDDGAAIRASVEWPTTDFQTSHEKRMEVSYVGVKTTGKMKLRTAVNGGEPRYFLIMPKSGTTKGTRVLIGKGLVGRYWSTRLDNVSGVYFDLESVEFNPVVGQRHGA